jgi:dihydroneopterin aldolase
MDSIHIKGIRAYGYTGFLAEEQVLGQWFEVDVTLWLDLSKAGQSDRIEDTIDYRTVISTVKKIIQDQTFALVERLTSAIADNILQVAAAQKIQVCLTKVSPPIPDFDGSIIVELTRPKIT